MTLVLLALVAAAVLAVVFGGRPSNFGRPPVSRLGLLGIAFTAYVTSPLAKFPGVCVGWLVLAMLAMGRFAMLNRGRPGTGLILVGLGLNALVIIVNVGMPVSLAAVQRAGVPASRVQLETDPLREELTDETVLPWLGEVVPLALPIRPAVASPGDLLIAAGVALFVFTGWTGIGRTMPEKVLTPKERKAQRKLKRAERASMVDDGDSRPSEAVLADSQMHSAADDRIASTVAVASALEAVPARADPAIASSPADQVHAADRGATDPVQAADGDATDSVHATDRGAAAPVQAEPVQAEPVQAAQVGAADSGEPDDPAAVTAAANEAELRKAERQEKKRKQRERKRKREEAAAAAEAEAAAAAEGEAAGTGEIQRGRTRLASVPLRNKDDVVTEIRPRTRAMRSTDDADSDETAAAPSPTSTGDRPAI